MLKASVPSDTAPTNLFRPRTRFFGRKDEMNAIQRGIADGRLTTIVGPPGVGKSRLAREVALACLVSPAYGLTGGVWSCDLHASRDVAALEAAVLTALDPGGHERDATQVLRQRGKTLLVLDGFESLATPAAAMVAGWLAAAPELQLVVTSRRLLHVEGERVVELAPLPSDDARALFEDRASTLVPTPPRWIQAQREATTQLVEALDGLPLAIELAASRTRLLSPAQLLENLDRHGAIVRGAPRGAAGVRALDEVLDRAWDDLDAHARVALANASVFEGGFDLRAAEDVLGAALENADADAPSREAARGAVLDVLQTLRDGSLVSVTEEDDTGATRFSLLVTIRAYGATHLAAHETAAAHTRHAAHYLSRFESDRVEDEDRRALFAERDNLLAVHTRALEAGRAIDALRAAIALSRLAPTLSYAWALSLLDAALARAEPRALAEEATLARALEARGSLLRFLGRVAESLETLARASDVAARCAPGALEGRIRLGLGNGCAVLSRWSEALAHFESAIDVFARLGERRLEGRARTMLAACAYNQDRLDDATKHLEAALRSQRDTGDRAFEAMSTTSMGIIALGRGDLLAARAYLDEAQVLLATVGDRHWDAVARGYRGSIALESGDRTKARELLAGAAATLGELGVRRAEAIFLGHLGHLAVEEGALDEALGHFHAALGWHRRTSPDYEGLTLGAIAGVTALRGDVDAAHASLARARLAVAAHPRPTFEAAVELHAALIDVTLARRAHVAGDEASSREAEARAKAVLARHGEGVPSVETRAARRTLARALEVLAGLRETTDAITDPRALVCDPQGRWFRAPGAPRVVRLHTRIALARILRALLERRAASPGEPLSVSDLLEAGWPGEKVLPAAGQERVYTAIATLRRLGLRSTLVRSDKGYAIAAETTCVATEVDPEARPVKAPRTTRSRA